MVATLKFPGAGVLLPAFAGFGTYFMAEYQSLPLAIAMACIPLAVVMVYGFPALVTIWKMSRAK